jgi:four helix bundle protein
MELARAIYKATRHFPPDERFGLTNQLRRAAVSIPSNIAEGKGRLTSGELLQFLGVARGSALELQTQLELACSLEFGNAPELAAAQSIVSEEIRILNASITTLRSRLVSKKQR